MDTRHIDALERELTDLSAELEIGTHRQLEILRELEPTGFWVEQGASSFAHWLSWSIGLAPGAARERIRVACALGALPAIDAAFAGARLSYSKVRAMTRVATPENEQVLLEMALRTTAAHLELICRGMRRADRDDALARDVESRWVRQRTGDHGMVRIDAQLHPDEGAIVWAALERARAEHGIPHADALVRVAAAFDAEGAAPARRPAEVVVHVREEMLEDGPGALAVVLEDGHRVPAETLRRVACDCVTQAVALDGDGLPIDVGRKRRTVTPALRRALIARDHGCRFPGCAHRAWLDAHHVEHWLEGGETAMANLVLLCPFHHRLVHEGGFSIARDQDRWAFRDPSGHEVRDRPPAPCLARDLLSSMRQARADAGTWRDDALVPLWDGAMPDIEASVMAGLQARGAESEELRA